MGYLDSASVTFYYIYGILLQLDRPNLLSNMSRLMVEFTNNRLDLDLNESQIENLSEGKNHPSFSNNFQQLQSGIINRTQAIMQDIVRSDIVGY